MKAKLILSAITGFFFGVIGYFILSLLKVDNAFQLSVVCGTGFMLLLFPLLEVNEKIVSKRYTEIEQKITSPVFYKINGNFNLGNGKVKNGNVYFCEDGIVCVCMDAKPYIFDEILLQDIDHYEFDHIHLNIFAKDGRIFVLTATDTNKVAEVLRQKGWI